MYGRLVIVYSLHFRIFTRSGSKPTLVFVHRDHSINNYVTEMRDLNLNAVAFYKEVVSGKVEDVRRFLEKFQSGLLLH